MKVSESRGYPLRMKATADTRGAGDVYTSDNRGGRSAAASSQWST